MLNILYIHSYISLFKPTFANPRSIQICNKTFFLSFVFFVSGEESDQLSLWMQKILLDYRRSVFAHSRSNSDVQHIFSGRAILCFGKRYGERIIGFVVGEKSRDWHLKWVLDKEKRWDVCRGLWMMYLEHRREIRDARVIWIVEFCTSGSGWYFSRMDRWIEIYWRYVLASMVVWYLYEILEGRYARPVCVVLCVLRRLYIVDVFVWELGYI